MTDYISQVLDAGVFEDKDDFTDYLANNGKIQTIEYIMVESEMNEWDAQEAVYALADENELEFDEEGYIIDEDEEYLDEEEYL